MSTNFAGLLIVLGTLAGAMLLGLVRSDIAVFTFVVIGWIVSLCLHEFAHAMTAHYGGDRSVAERGYLTLDPVRYVDPLGSLILPLAILALGGIGLPGAAVYIQRHAIRSAVMQSLMSLAGPMANLALLIVLSAPFALGLAPDSISLDTPGGALWAGLAFLAFLQATAVVFNLLPVPPFDGFGAIEPFLPRPLIAAIDPLRPYLLFGVVGLLLLVPGVGLVFFGLAITLADMAGLSLGWFQEGFQRFRFWETPLPV
jgi:Zn-dependent protease